MVKIYITGCAKSGTTLLNNMFNAFTSCYVIQGETQLYNFASLTPNRIGDFDFVVAKRTWDTVYSCGRVSKDQTDKQLALIEENKILIVNVIRDGRDVICSYEKDWDLNGCFEWMLCAEEAKSDKIVCNVRYEDLINNPDEVQHTLMVRLGVKRENHFSSYPDFMPGNFSLEDTSINKNYQPRPLDKTRIKKDINLYKKIKPNDVKHFEKLLKYYDYE